LIPDASNRAGALSTCCRCRRSPPGSTSARSPYSRCIDPADLLAAEQAVVAGKTSDHTVRLRESVA
jgi:hypothetical protein